MNSVEAKEVLLKQRIKDREQQYILNSINGYGAADPDVPPQFHNGEPDTRGETERPSSPADNVIPFPVEPEVTGDEPDGYYEEYELI